MLIHGFWNTLESETLSFFSFLDFPLSFRANFNQEKPFLQSILILLTKKSTVLFGFRCETLRNLK